MENIKAQNRALTNSSGIFLGEDMIARIDSRTVAESFGKPHQDVLEEIENLDCSAYFRQLNFELSAYTDNNGKACPCYTMTREGFICLTSGWTEDNAGKIRYYYIHVFGDVEALIGNKLKQKYKGEE